MKVESNGGMILTGETEELGENPCPSATLSTTNSGRELGPRLATNFLSHYTARITLKWILLYLYLCVAYLTTLSQ
jgi:hypothetical protein